LAGKTYSHDVFRGEAFPLEWPDWRVVYCNGFILCISNPYHLQLFH